jgi:hypothetical protein
MRLNVSDIVVEERDIFGDGVNRSRPPQGRHAGGVRPFRAGPSDCDLRMCHRQERPPVVAAAFSGTFDAQFGTDCNAPND